MKALDTGTMWAVALAAPGAVFLLAVLTAGSALAGVGHFGCW
ncbi:MAG TPA: hypothetical protein VIV06_07700 [Candidatus Limnocylindrales bacterium]